MKISKQGFFSSLVLLLFFTVTALTGCAAPQKGAAVQMDQEVQPINTFAVLPTETLAENESMLTEEGKKEMQKGREVFDAQLARFFLDRREVRVLPRVDLKGLEHRGRLDFARSIGRQLGDDAVLVTFLNRYEQRQGGSLTAVSPSSVAFSYKLLAVETGQELCAGDFSETQQGVLENLFKLSSAAGRGFKWAPVEQLVEEGLKSELGRCSYFDPSHK